MLRINKYCSNCLRTETFADVGDHLICLRCCKQLWKILPVPAPKPLPVPAPAPAPVRTAA